MLWNKLLNLPDLLVVGESKQFENGHENMKAASLISRMPCKSISIAFRSNHCSWALSLCLLKQVGNGSLEIE